MIKFSDAITTSNSITVRNSEIHILSSLTFNGAASARFNLGQGSKITYGSVNAVLSTSHIMGGDSISHPDASSPFLDLSEAKLERWRQNY